MNRRFLIKLAFALTLMLLGLARIGFEVGIALADSPPAAGSGSGSTPAPAPPALHDPSTDPIGALADLKSVGWPTAVLVGCYLLLEGLAWLGRRKDNARLAWLGKGRVSIAIAGGTAIAAAMFKMLASGGSWGAVFGAGAAALLLYWHPAGVDPAKA